MGPLTWSLLLLLLAIIFIALETVIPSAGIMAVLAVASIFSAIVVAFQGGFTMGMSMVLATLVLVPISIVLAVRVWPHTPIGRLLLMQRPKPEDLLPNTAAHQERQDMVGAVGRAKTDLLPSGAVVITGKTFEALSEGKAINSGDAIKVVALRTNRLVVKPATEAELAAGDRTPVVNDAADASQAEDLFSKPLEDFGLDSLEDPLE